MEAQSRLRLDTWSCRAAAFFEQTDARQSVQIRPIVGGVQRSGPPSGAASRPDIHARCPRVIESDCGERDQPQGEWMDGYRKRRYGLSDDTWTRATTALEHYGLLQVSPAFDGDDDHEVRRRRRYRVLKEMLNQRPDWARGPS